MQEMTDSPDKSETYLLCNAGDLALALPAEHIDRISRPDAVDSSTHELLSADRLLHMHPEPAAWREPKAVITAIDNKQTALIIDQPREISAFPPEAVLPMPPLVYLSSSHQLITKALVHEDTIYCIINLSHPNISEETYEFQPEK